MNQENLQCAKCGSSQLSANKKGFSGTKAVGGAILTGGIGLLAGTHGSNKILITCLSCGHQFKPGQDKQGKQTKLRNDRENAKKMAATMKKPLFWVIIVCLLIVTGIVFGGDKAEAEADNSTDPSVNIENIASMTMDKVAIVLGDEDSIEIVSPNGLPCPCKKAYYQNGKYEILYINDVADWITVNKDWSNIEIPDETKFKYVKSFDDYLYIKVNSY